MTVVLDIFFVICFCSSFFFKSQNLGYQSKFVVIFFFNGLVKGICVVLDFSFIYWDMAILCIVYGNLVYFDDALFKLLHCLFLSPFITVYTHS